MNDWLGLALGVIGVLAGVAAMLCWTGAWMLRTLDRPVDTKVNTNLDAKLYAVLEVKVDALAKRVDALETESTHSSSRATTLPR
ncbi:MAG: hypothetical protein QM714_11375 [Nocardioides sp.]|uniref:hypothetical protein n=1 Tax=Nocardioides sp. TaxID=35761 RepID=UPI0039E4EA65